MTTPVRTSESGLGKEKVHNLVYTCPVDHVGTSVFVKGWLIPGKQHRPVILVHDLGETADSLSAFAKSLARHSYSAYCFDMRGHGQSGRRLGHVPSFGQLSHDLLQVAAWVRHKEQGRRPVIVAQGVGALVALFFAKGFQKYCSSMVLISPIFALKDVLTPFRRFLIKRVADFFPTMMLPGKICPVFTEGYKENRQARNPPKISAQLANELLNAVSQARKLLNRHSVPTLFLCPADDTVCRYDFLKKLLQKPRHRDRHQIVFLNSNQHQLMSAGPEAFSSLAAYLFAWLEISEHQQNPEVTVELPDVGPIREPSSTRTRGKH